MRYTATKETWELVGEPINRREFFLRVFGVRRRRRRRRRDGVILLAVLVVIVILTLAAYQFSDSMVAHSKTADSYIRSAQARAIADAGIQYAAALLSNSTTFSDAPLNGNPWNSPSAFQGIIVQSSDTPRSQGRFSLIAMLDPDNPSNTNSDQPYFFGVNDESAKINLNAMMQIDSSGNTLSNMLLTLPNMTADIANSILDWIDTDDETRTNGAETDYYSGLSPSLVAKNGPLDTLDELLLVKGVTYQLLYGNDLNKNGTLEPDEDDGSGVSSRGWSAYLTVYSRETNVDSQGVPRLYINTPDLQTLYTNLNTLVGQQLATYIIAYRLYGGTATPASGATSGAASSGAGQNVSINSLNLSQGGAQSISSLYALVNSSVTIPASAGQPATVMQSPLNDPGTLQQYLPILLDGCSTSQATELPARINVNTAPQTVLAGLPGVQDSDVQSILANRPDPNSTEPPDPIYETATWLITKANMTAQQLQTLDKYITARTQVYRVQSVGYFDGGGPAARVEAIIDTNIGRPRIIYYRDLTELGKGFNLQQSP